MRALLLILLTLSIAAPAWAAPCDRSLQSYVGTYVPGSWSLEGQATIALREGRLTWGPPLWKPARVLRPVSADLFQMEDREDRQFRFSRDAQGCVMQLEGFGFDSPLRRTRPGEVSPLAMLLAGRVKQAFPRLRALAGDNPKSLAQLGQRLLHVPSALRSAVLLGQELTRTYPRSADAWLMLADAQVAMGRTKDAHAAFTTVLELDGAHSEATRALAMLDAVTTPGLPFALDEAFTPPTRHEVEDVRAGWKRFDASAKDVQVVQAGDVVLHGVAFQLRIISVTTETTQQYGAVLVPAAIAGKLPVLIETKGVSPSFFPLRIPEGIESARVLGADVGRFILVIPGFRGEEVRWRDQSWKSTSEHESWSGAADDTLAFLNAALALTPQADAQHMGIFGRSRGGTVALLVAERDARVRTVVAWAAPSDWFSLMAEDGWSLSQTTGDAIRNKVKLSDRGGQYRYNFLRHAVNGHEDLKAVRRRILASSPLYFADALPMAQVHYGVEDSIVPQVNGRRLAQAAKVDAHFHADAGHDQDLFVAPRLSRAFLLRGLGLR